MLSSSEKTALIWLFERQGTPLDVMVRELAALLDEMKDEGRLFELKTLAEGVGVEVPERQNPHVLYREVFGRIVGVLRHRGRRDLTDRIRRMRKTKAENAQIEVGCRVRDVEDGWEGLVTLFDPNYKDFFVKWDNAGESWIDRNRLKRIG